MKETKKQIMEGAEYTKARIVANNTVEYHKDDGTRVIRLYHTDILNFSPDGSITFNSGGYKTPTTKNRMNDFQSQCTILQEKGLWYLLSNNISYPAWARKDGWVPFFDGITIKDGKVTNPKETAHQRDKTLLKQIQEYCNEMKKLEALPLPSKGDCFDCSFHTEDGTPMGDHGKHEHLLSHIEEKYINGALLFNALMWGGYANPEIIFQMGLNDQIINATRRYLKTKLGLAA